MAQNGSRRIVPAPPVTPRAPKQGGDSLPNINPLRWAYNRDRQNWQAGMDLLHQAQQHDPGVMLSNWLADHSLSSKVTPNPPDVAMQGGVTDPIHRLANFVAAGKTAGGLGGFAGSLIGGGSVAAPDTPPSIDEQLTALLSSSGGGGGGVPMPSLNDYVAPYDQAAQAAQTANTAAVGQIGQTYDALKQSIDARTADYQAKQAQLDAQHAAASAQLRQEAAQQMQAPAGAESNGALSQAVAGQQQARLLQQQAASQDLSSNLLSAALDSRNSTADAAQGAKAAALTTAGANLQRLLNQIGLGKAQATRQYLSDAGTAARQNAAVAQNDQQVRINNLLKLKQLQDTGAVGGGIASLSNPKLSGRDFISASAPDLIQKYPTTMKIASAIIDQAGSNPLAAQQILKDSEPYLRAGRAKDGSGTFNPFDDTAMQRLSQILAAWYSTKAGTAQTVGQ